MSHKVEKNAGIVGDAGEAIKAVLKLTSRKEQRMRSDSQGERYFFASTI